MTPSERAAAITQVETRLAMYITAEQKVLIGGQSMSIDDRTLTRADADFIYKKINLLRGQLLRLKRGGRIRVQRFVPRGGI